jgi:hypothetical protein
MRWYGLSLAGVGYPSIVRIMVFGEPSEILGDLDY